MKLETNYRTIKRRYPEALRELSKKLTTDPTTWKLWFDWSVEMSGSLMSFQDLIAGLGKPKQPEKPKTIEEEVNDYRKRCRVIVTAQEGPRKFAHSQALSEIPTEILEQHCELVKADRKEQKRVDSLTPEERDREIEETLTELRKDPGFIQIKF